MWAALAVVPTDTSLKNHTILGNEIKHMEIDDTVDIGKEPLPVSDKDKEVNKWITDNLGLFMKDCK